jgi:YD repeat-containing protein
MLAETLIALVIAFVTPPIALAASAEPIKVAETQVTIYGPDGRVQGRAVPQGEGSVRYYDAQGRSLGTSTTDQSGTTRYWDSSGKSLGTSTGPAPARPSFPSR